MTLSRFSNWSPASSWNGIQRYRTDCDACEACDKKDVTSHRALGFSVRWRVFMRIVKLQRI